jgi:hypothetical protein
MTTFTYTNSDGFNSSIMKEMTDKIKIWVKNKPVLSYGISDKVVFITTDCDSKTHNKTCRLLANLCDKYVLKFL